MSSHGRASAGNVAFLAKQMRKLDDAQLDAIRDAMSKDGEAARRDTAMLHRAYGGARCWATMAMPR